MGDENKDERIVTLDKLDKTILELINDDARNSYRQISRELNISVGTVHNRVHRMMETGLIKKFAPIIDSKQLGYNLTAIIGVRVNGGHLKDSFNKTLEGNVFAIYEVTGEYDVFLLAKFKDTDELDKFVKKLLKEADVERTYTQTVLNVVKEELNSFTIF